MVLIRNADFPGRTSAEPVMRSPDRTGCTGLVDEIEAFLRATGMGYRRFCDIVGQNSYLRAKAREGRLKDDTVIKIRRFMRSHRA